VTTPVVPLTSGNTRVKEARKLSRRSVRSERRLFLADGPKSVEAALAVDGCVVEVFATVEATDRFAAWRDDAPAWAVVDDRALASLSDSVTPAGVVAVCHFLDVPWPLVEEGRSPVMRPRDSWITSRPRCPDPLWIQGILGLDCRAGCPDAGSGGQAPVSDERHRALAAA
jgi:hypothetical protein